METTLVVRARTPTLTQLEEVLIDLDLPVGRTVNYHDFLRRFVPAHEPPARPGAGEPAHWRIRTPRELRHAPAVDGRQLLEEFRVGRRPADVVAGICTRSCAGPRIYTHPLYSRASTRARRSVQHRRARTDEHARARARAHTCYLDTRTRTGPHTRAFLIMQTTPCTGIRIRARQLSGTRTLGGGSESESETRIEWAAPTIRATVWWDSAAAWPAPTA